MSVTEWQKTLPMKFTLARICAVPLIIIAMYPNTVVWNALAAVLFVLASITDYYDGYFARKYNAVSTMGKFMDPIADKILVTGVLTMLLYQTKVDPWMVLLILSRDTFIGGIRSLAATDQIIIDAKPTGKWKTALQMIGIPSVILGASAPYFFYVDKLGYFLLWVSVILSITSGVEYYRGYLKSRKGKL